jgi:hypothetical protein
MVSNARAHLLEALWKHAYDRGVGAARIEASADTYNSNRAGDPNGSLLSMREWMAEMNSALFSVDKGEVARSKE